jgi:poly-gamma-glutamate synthesis protein (capsule biosynthesis protein)
VRGNPLENVRLLANPSGNLALNHEGWQDHQTAFLIRRGNHHEPPGRSALLETCRQSAMIRINAFFGCSDLLNRNRPRIWQFEAHLPTILTSHRAPAGALSPCQQWPSLAKAGFRRHGDREQSHPRAGHGGLIDTLNLLRSQGIKTVGAGGSLAEARAAAIVERGGVRVGFLGFRLVYQAGYEARTSTPGLSAMRIHSHYFIRSGTPTAKSNRAVVRRFEPSLSGRRVDLLKSLIADLRAKADVIVVSHHWDKGRSARPPDRLRAVLGHASIEAGADLVLGHHHHFLRGIEIYRGKSRSSTALVTLYSICLDSGPH